MTVGAWDDALFLAFRRAKAGRRRAAMKNRLVVENEPLVKLLVAQLCGRADQTKRKGRRRSRMGGLQGADAIPWDDAMQAGRLGLSKALDAFDPAQGKISGYLLWKIRYELQKVLEWEPMAHVPPGKGGERPHVDLAVDDETLDRLAGGEGPWLADCEGVTPEVVAGWQASGEWPETLEEAREWLAAKARALVVVPQVVAITARCALAWFVRDELEFAPSARTPRSHVMGAFERQARRWGVVLSDESGLRRELTTRGVRTKTTMRVDWSDNPIKAMAGVGLRHGVYKSVVSRRFLLEKNRGM